MSKAQCFAAFCLRRGMQRLLFMKDMRGEPPSSEERPSRGRRMLGRAAKIAVGTAAVSDAAIDIMYLILFGRSKPADRAEFPLKGWAAARGLTWSREEFFSGDNKLCGYLVYGADPRAFIIYVHGMNSCSNGLESVVKFFAENGYAVFIFDGTACGRSGGDKVSGLQQPRLDLRAAAEHFAEKGLFAGTPLVLMGHSAGAYGAASEASNLGASAVVCISGFDSPISTMHGWARKYVRVLGDIHLPFLLAHEYSRMGSDAITSASHALAASGVPALVIHGANDEIIPLGISIYSKLAERAAPGVTCLLESTAGRDTHSEIIIDGHGQPNMPLLHSINGFLSSVLQ